MKSWTVHSYSQSHNNASLMSFDGDGNIWFLSKAGDRIFSKNANSVIEVPHFIKDIISFYFLVIDGIWVIATTNEIFTYTDQTWSKMGEIDMGIKVFQWSPDESVIVIITGENKLILLSPDFQVLNESDLDNDSVPLENLVALGWGKKETQFHGSEGKAAALVKSVGKLSENDDGNIRVSWRADAEYFVVSFVKGDRRSLKVYNRMGGLHSESEELSSLEHAVAWRPSGNWITSSQKLPNLHNIVLIEKNGLKHREFSLRTSDCIVNEVSWNCDSTGLALQIFIPSLNSYELQFWSSGNYHWYLKHSITFNSSDGLLKFYWDPLQPLLIHYVTVSGIYHRMKFVKDVYVSTSLTSENPGTVAVVDGSSLKMTPFRIQNVPPPMSSLSLELPRPISHVSFLGTGNGDDICVMLNDDQLYFFKSQIDCPKIQLPILIGTLSLKDQESFHYRQVHWARKDLVVAIVHHKNEGYDGVLVLKIKEEESKVYVTNRELVRVSHQNVVRLHISSLGHILVLDEEGMIFELEIGAETTISKMCCESFPEVCSWFTSLTVGMENSEVAYIGLTESNKLYFNQKLLSSECTSYFLHNRHILYTTFSHKLCLLPRKASFQDVDLDTMDPSPYNDQLRRVEIGSQIVIALPDDTKIIFQMPRGNLETVCPRALLLEQIKSLLKNKEYLPAFLICRKNRLDLNLLIDYDMEAFVRDIRIVLGQIENPEHINLLIASLKNENVTQTIYKSSFENGDNGLDASEKTNIVCDLIVSTLESLNEDKYTTSILTGLSKKSPPDLENATRKILNLKETKGAEYADEAIKYLIFLADPNKLFDFALGVYDFELVVMVAQNSQKDPRDYLQFLNSLKKLEENLQRFTIDDHLGRFEKALKNLVLSGDIEKSFDYIKQHGLYKPALDIFANDQRNYFRALIHYAEYLETNEEFEEAAALYLLAKNESKSLDCYKKSLSWQEAFTVAHILNYSDEELFKMGSEIIKSLLEANKHHHAARVAMDYQSDISLAIEILSLGGYWNEAVRIGMKHNIPEVMKNLIQPKMLESLKYLRDDIYDLSTSFKRDKERISQVRKKNARKKEFANDPNLENIDLQSDTSSMATTFISGTSLSNMSSRTARTAKQKRKMERKKAAGKVEAFQEEFLTESLRKHIEKGNDLQVDVGGRIRFMIVHGYFSEAKALQTEFSDLIDLMKESIPEIFIEVNKLTLDEIKSKWINDPMSLTEIPEQKTPPILQQSKWKVDFISR